MYDSVQRGGRDIEVQAFTRRRLLHRYDVVHVNWPQFLVRWGNRSEGADVIKVLSLLALSRHRGAVLVLTGHDLEAHEHAGRRLWLQRLFMSRFVAMVDGLISHGDAATAALIDRYPALSGVPVLVVPHGHYRNVYPPVLSRAVARAQLGLDPQATVYLCVGQIRRYKNLTQFARTFAADASGQEHLVVAGEVRDERLGNELSELALSTPRVKFRPGVVPSDELATLHGAADAVVLPYRRRSVLHSGAAIMALSFDRPVVVTDSPTMRELQAVVGSAWVCCADANPASVLETARAAVRFARTDRAPLDQLGWDTIGQGVANFYASLLQTKGREGRRLRFDK
jgi:glycosyltransferase involved in cell wall biosynthesis